LYVDSKLFNWLIERGLATDPTRRKLECNGIVHKTASFVNTFFGSA